MTAEALSESTMTFVEDKKNYYKQWIFDSPVLVQAGEYSEFEAIQSILYKLITHFVVNYQELKHLMPIDADAERVLAAFSSRPYNPGTYRTDFVYDAEGQAKLIEITCRFALNGVFFSSIFNNLADEYCESSASNLLRDDRYSSIFAYLESLRNNAETLVVLIGEDQSNESKIFTDIYKRMGVSVKAIHYSDIGANLTSMADAWIVSELALEEISSLPTHTLKTLSTYNIINDFRTAFLIHDKRFFSVLGNTTLQKTVLTLEEVALLSKFHIPTYRWGEKYDIWALAKTQKNNWIIKHRTLGKSQEIYAGPVTSEEEWSSLFEVDNVSDMVLQQWIPQSKSLHGTIGEQSYHDYVTGSAMFFDNNFFGFVEFRTSSYPVTNKVDHRKAYSIVLNDDQIDDINLKDCHKISIKTLTNVRKA